MVLVPESTAVPMPAMNLSGIPGTIQSEADARAIAKPVTGVAVGMLGVVRDRELGDSVR